MPNKTPQEAALMDFIDVFDEVIFEDTCTDKMRERAVEAYVRLRTVLATESVARLKTALESDPEIMKAMAETDPCNCPCNKQKEPLKLLAPRDVSTGKIDAAGKLEKKKAALRKAAVTVFEGFAVGMRFLGSTSLTVDHENLIWRIYWTLTPSQAVQAGMKEPSKTRHWCWSLLPDFLENPSKSFPALYSLGREQAATLCQSDAAIKSDLTNPISDSYNVG